MSDASSDPVRVNRARMARVASIGQRSGAACFAFAFVLLVAGLATRFTATIAGATVAGLVVGSVLLAPSIILGFAVRAAERDDRERGL